MGAIDGSVFSTRVGVVMVQVRSGSEPLEADGPRQGEQKSSFAPSAAAHPKTCRHIKPVSVHMGNFITLDVKGRAAKSGSKMRNKISFADEFGRFNKFPQAHEPAPQAPQLKRGRLLNQISERDPHCCQARCERALNGAQERA